MNRLRLLHLSDLHCGPPYIEEVGEAMLRVAPEIGAQLIVVSGDFTQRAKREQFVQARAILDNLPAVPRVVVPGNHDVPLYRAFERLTRPHALYREYISSELDVVTAVEGATIVALDSTAPRRSISNGRIGLEQLELCARVFDDAPPEDVRIVVAHHHFAPAPDYERDQVMPDAKRALDRLVALRVDLILGGHLHRAYVGNSLDVYSGGDREHGIIIVQCGTTTSRRGRGKEREKNSFNVIDIVEDMLEVTHHMYFTDVGGFEPVSRHHFPRPGRRFTERLIPVR